jgi:hypothetical protein
VARVHAHAAVRRVARAQRLNLLLKVHVLQPAAAVSSSSSTCVTCACHGLSGLLLVKHCIGAMRWDLPGVREPSDLCSADMFNISTSGDTTVHACHAPMLALIRLHVVVQLHM